MEWHMRSRKSYHMECMCPVNYLKCVFACTHRQEREREKDENYSITTNRKVCNFIYIEEQ
jgi:hypothetical protein